MATISGPYSSTEWKPHPKIWTYRIWYRNRNVYKCNPVGATPAPYSTWVCWSSPDYYDDAPNAWAGNDIRVESSPPELVTASSRAYSQFTDKVKSSAGWGENLAQRSQAVSMIANRGRQIARAFNAVRKGKIGAAFDALGLLPSGKPKVAPKSPSRYQPLSWRKIKPPRKRDGSKSRRVSETWLEMHFGWAPLVDDIYTSVDLLQSNYPVKPFPITGRGSGRRYLSEGRICSAKILYQAEATVTNPNLYLANQLGLANPIGLLWELIPFSFVVDWFTTVGQFLNSFMDFVGVTFSKAFTTVTRKYLWPGRGQGAVTMSRSLGISAPILGRKSFNGFSVTRGVTAIALVLTSFKHGLP
ncbi:MAG: maturation protein [Sanya fiers-like virus 16]|nr:MAG: maturation protein [Sanya fiers-like virus 16]